MALKADRVIIETDITLQCMSVSNRGSGFVLTATGSGVAIGDSAGQASMVNNPSGYVFAGLLLNDVVLLDETRYHRNWMKQQQVVGERSTLLRKGKVTTDQVYPGYSPAPGVAAYLNASGLFGPKNAVGGTVATPPVGVWKSALDENLFATIEVNLPTAIW